MPNDLLWLIPVAVLLIVVTAAFLLRGRKPTAPPPTPAPIPEPEEVALQEAAPPEGVDEAVSAEPVVEPLGAVAVAEPPVPVLEAPEPARSRWSRLKERLARSGSPLGARLLTLLSRDRLDEDTWDEIEETLLLADVGADPTTELMTALRTRIRVLGDSEPNVRDLLHEELVKLVDPSMDRELNVTGAGGNPGVVLVVGVNGTGKTTTVGKLARVFVADGKSVVLGAADTFRAAAADQLETWGARVGVPTIRSDRDGADPASVAFDAVQSGKADGVDVVVIDTAGRLHTKTGLMDELGKIVRVVQNQAPITETLLVLDATTGQNGMNQARVFAEVAGITGIVLTKLDGTAKGGIVIAVQRELGVPVKLIGLGEGPDDLAPFEPTAFVDGLLG
jgi:fused signal recognition particle receptor